MITINQVEGGFILTYESGRQQVVTSYRKLYAIIHEMFGHPRHEAPDMGGQIEQPNQ